ncbi:MAG: CIA30 family protein [Elusimicrobia bacterium]|nr:CIA30 family protein [Elusimicrobiota bacterium]
MRVKISLLCASFLVIFAFGSLKAQVLDDMSETKGWITEGENGTSIKISSEKKAMNIDYDFGDGKWVQVKKNFKLGISNLNTLKFRLKGTGKSNDFQIKIEDADGTNFGYTFSGITSNGSWKEYEVPLKSFKYFWSADNGDSNMDWSNIKMLYFAISVNEGGKGTVLLDDVKIEKTSLKAPVTQEKYYYITGDSSIAKKAAKWILSMQQKSGFVLSYEGDSKPFGWTYDQALCLIVLAHEYPDAAVKLLDALRKLQKPEGYWNDGMMLDTGVKIELSDDDKKKWFLSDVPGVKYEFDNRWVGAVSWIVHAIERYTEITGDKRYVDMMKKGAKWLKTQQKADGSLHDSTEGNIDSWWALKAGGFNKEADLLKKYLLTKVWDKEEGRFLVGLGNPKVYLDPQTWGASFSVRAGVPEYGLRALAFVREYLECQTFDRRTRGFDTTGPYTVWNEGTLQYVVAGGKDSKLYLKEINKQQREDGALQHSHEEYLGGGAWHTTMYGVCPTAWLYFANIGTEPFPGK